MFSEFCCGIEVSLAECGATAAATVFYERNFESERFEHFHGSDADVRFVIAHKRVVPKDHGATAVAAGVDRGSSAGVTAPGYSGGVRRGGRPTMSAKPFVEAFTCVMGQRASCGDSDCFLRAEAGSLQDELEHRFRGDLGCLEVEV